MPFAVGVILGIFVGGLGTFTRMDRDRAYYTVTAIVVASYYSLFAAEAGANHALLVETLIGTAFLIAAIIGFKSSLWIVAGTLAGHAGLDSFHGSVVQNPGVPAWWPAFCGSIDVTMALYLAWLLRTGRRTA